MKNTYRLIALLLTILLAVPANLAQIKAEEIDEFDIIEEIVEDEEDFEEEFVEDEEEIEVENVASQKEIQRAQELKEALDKAEVQLRKAEDLLENYEEKVSLGTIGFFESLGATEAANVIRNAKYIKYTKIGDKKDATSLDNMKETFDLIREGNQLRNNHGSGTLKVSHKMMAIAQTNANASKTLFNHSYQYQVGENLAWYYQDPYAGWYDEEKLVYDYKKAHPNATKQEIADALGLFSTDDVQIDHYINLLDNYYNVTGFGISKDKYGRKTFCQVFNYTKEATYTIDEYEAMFDAYCESLNNPEEAYNEALSSYNEALAAYNESKVYEVTLNADGGQMEVDSIYVTANGTYGKLPEPVKEGYEFTGWYTEDGQEVNEETEVELEADTTLYAAYEEVEDNNDNNDGFTVPEEPEEPTTPTEPEQPSQPEEPTTPAEPEQPAVKTVDVYRLYHKSTGEHLYTLDAEERDILVKRGWVYEGVAWQAPETSNTPVYRLYNKSSGDHHYTKDKAEYDLLKKYGWVQEGIVWYSDDNEGVPVYRLYNSHVKVGTHHYTTDKAEYDLLKKYGWIQEGISWYGVAQ